MDIIIDNIDHIGEAAQQFIDNLPAGNVFAFYGKMGAGKTTFIKALCQKLGVEDEVTSPTFAIVNEYQAGDQCPTPLIYHFDFYRIKRLEEAYDIGFDDYIDSGNLCFIEWPELIEDLLPEDATSVSIEEKEDGSRIVSF
ncbi:MAG: tRNA (adenosine(37)-N6)-threonylcarbamoyltransferase complex ATPase subunit type 1 TsaE [Prevotella sp.]|nr:tRNA (adenosine(37)-N6)-threonylcarbamoyltransferase complex ATPase subunit type 1 TsaE [Prevotella sp.]